MRIISYVCPLLAQSRRPLSRECFALDLPTTVSLAPQLWFFIRIFATKFVFLVASTTIECGRYPVEIFMMGEEAKLAGQQEYHRNLRTLSDCLNTDEWPAIKTLSLPRWAKEYAND